MEKQIIKKEQQPLNKIIQNRDHEGHILTYSIFVLLSGDYRYEIERNTRKELKCFEVKE